MLSLRNIAKKVGDVLGAAERQVNTLDNGRTAKQLTPTNDRSVVGQLTHNGVTNTVGNFVAKPLVINPSQILAETGRAVTAELSNNAAATRASQARQAVNIQNSLPYGIGNMAVRTGQAFGNTAFRAPILDLMGKTDQANQVRDTAQREFNQTPFGQITRPIQEGILNAGKATDAQRERVGLDPKATGAQKYFADPVTGALTVAVGGNGVKVVKGEPVIKPVLADGPRPTIRLSEAPKPTKPIDVSKIGGLRDQFGEAFIDKDAPIINVLKKIDKNNGGAETGQFLYNSNLQRNTPSIAEHAFRNDQNIQSAIGGLSKRDYEDFTAYAAARREYANAQAGLQTSVPKDKLKQVVATYHDRFKENFAALNSYYKDLANRAHDAGVIDDAKLANYKKDGDFIRLQRDMGDLQTVQGQGSGYSLGSSVTNQKRTGSKREVLDPVHTALDYANKVQLEASRNTTAKHLTETLANNGLAKKLVDAGDVRFRREMRQFLADTREGKQMSDRLVQKYNKQSKALQTEVSQLSKRGLHLSLKRDLKGIPDFVVEGLGGKVGSRPRVQPKLSARDTRALVSSLITKDPAELTSIRKKLSLREPRLSQLLDDVAQARDTNEAFRIARREAWNAAAARADASTKNKNTLSFMNNGIREVYEVPAEIKRVAGQIEPFRLGPLAQIAGFPARVLRSGATALNPVFTASNVVKDQVGSAVISSKTRATHTPQTFGAGLKNSARDFVGAKVDPLYNEYISRAGNRTQYDLTRNAKNTAEIVERVRGGRKTGLKQSLLHPIRTLEDANAITERATRFQNFKGIYEDAIRQGKPHEAALQDATMAALEHTVNFGRAGSWGRIVNLAIPYSNAAIQGGRTLANAVKARPYATVSKGFAWVGTPVAAATLWNTADPQRKEAYENVSEYEKRNNIILLPPGTKVSDVKSGAYEAIKVPLPPDLSSVFDPIRRAIEQAKGVKGTRGVTPGNVATDITKPFVGPLDLSSKSNFASSVTPQAAKVAVNQAANKDFYTGKQIVPDYQRDSISDPTKRVYKNTSSTGRLIGEAGGFEPTRVDQAAKDIAGNTGRIALNVFDNALAKLGLAKKNDQGEYITGGVALPKAFTSRFAQAVAKEDPNNASAQYYKKVIAEYNKLDKNEKAAYDTLHTTKVDGLKPDKTLYDASVRAGIYSKYPKVLGADQAINKDSADPFWKLPAAQQKVVISLDSLSNDPGSNTGKKITKDNPWLQDYYDKRSSYFDALATSGAFKDAQGSTLPKPPTADNSTQRLLDQYGTIADSKQKAQFITDNPAISDYFAASEDYQRQKRSILGLPQFDKYPEASPDVKRKLGVYNSLPQHDGKKGGNATRSAYLKANPDVSDYFAAASQYGVVKDAQLAVFEGEDFSDKNKSKVSGSSSGYGSSSNGERALNNPYAATVSGGGEKIKKPVVSVKKGKARTARKARPKIATKLTKSRV